MEREKLIQFLREQVKLHNITLWKNDFEFADDLLALFSVSNTEGELCDKCYDTGGFYLGTTCPKCNKPFRSVKA